MQQQSFPDCFASLWMLTEHFLACAMLTHLILFEEQTPIEDLISLVSSFWGISWYIVPHCSIEWPGKINFYCIGLGHYKGSRSYFLTFQPLPSPERSHVPTSKTSTACDSSVTILIANQTTPGLILLESPMDLVLKDNSPVLFSCTLDSEGAKEKAQHQSFSHVPKWKWLFVGYATLMPCINDIQYLAVLFI